MTKTPQQVLSTSLLSPVLIPLSIDPGDVAALQTLSFWSVAVPALAAAFGAQAQHLAAAGDERQHRIYCAALAVGHTAAGACDNT